MNWLHYLAEANIYLGVFYLAYCLFLDMETHYQLSRAYLILSCVISFILPVLQVGALKPGRPAEAVNNLTYAAPATVDVVAETAPPVAVITAAAPKTKPYINIADGLWFVYLMGTAVSMGMLCIKLFALFRLTRNAQHLEGGRYRLIRLPGTNAAFSFFNFIFIGDNAPLPDTMIRHELVHMRQKHSADVVFLELLKIMNWFNPVVYLLQNSLKTIHEYAADEQTAACETDTLTYATFLLNNAYGVGGSTITHSFFNYNLLKKRIIMLNQQRSGNLARLKYLVAIPICAALICASTLVFSKTYGWVDLAPAHLKSVGGLRMLNTNGAVLRKRLKITQNGVTRLTDRFSIDQPGKKVIYTAGNLTVADKLILLKKHHIKAEVVTDSTRLTTKDGQLILPVVNADGYYALDHFLHNYIRYATAKGEKGGLAEVAFTLDANRRITNARIVRSGGAKLDALALNGFNAYKGIVNDDPGKNLKIGVYFFTGDYTIFKTDSLQQDPEFGGELIITNYKYPVTRTSKGYEYDENGIGFPGDDNNMRQAKVVIYDENGDANWYYYSKCTPADLQQLKDKYGYTFPSSASNVVQFIDQKGIRKYRLAYIFSVESSLEAPYTGKFYNDMINNTAYPEQAKKTHTGGVVVLNFTLDNNGMISDVSVAKGAGNGFDEAAVNALRSYKSAINDVAGQHSIAILFCVAENKYRPVAGKVNAAGYVGELAISDIKSPFVNGTAKYTPAAMPVEPKN
jgi:TonB family protein